MPSAPFINTFPLHSYGSLFTSTHVLSACMFLNSYSAAELKRNGEIEHPTAASLSSTSHLRPSVLQRRSRQQETCLDFCREFLCRSSRPAATISPPTAMYSSSYSRAKFGLEAREPLHKPKGKSCSYYMKIIFFFSSLIQSLIIVSLVLFLIYGQPEKSAEEKRVKVSREKSAVGPLAQVL